MNKESQEPAISQVHKGNKSDIRDNPPFQYTYLAALTITIVISF